MFLWQCKSCSLAFTPVHLNTTEHLADILEWQIGQHRQMLKQKCYVFRFYGFFLFYYICLYWIWCQQYFIFWGWNRGTFTTVLHHLSFKQHSVNVWDLTRDIAGALKMRCCPILLWCRISAAQQFQGLPLPNVLSSWRIWIAARPVHHPAFLRMLFAGCSLALSYWNKHLCGWQRTLNCILFIIIGAFEHVQATYVTCTNTLS